MCFIVSFYLQMPGSKALTQSKSVETEIVSKQTTSTCSTSSGKQRLYSNDQSCPRAGFTLGFFPMVHFHISKPKLPKFLRRVARALQRKSSRIEPYIVRETYNDSTQEVWSQGKNNFLKSGLLFSKTFSNLDIKNPVCHRITSPLQSIKW